MTTDHTTAAALPILDADEPIDELEQDALGRGPFARALASSILRAPTHTGFVVGLAGPWGSGKTSIINLARKLIEADKDKNGRPNYVIVEFNPWLFAGTEQLVARFFLEVGNKLTGGHTQKLKRIGKEMTKYGDALSKLAFIPLLGTGVGLVGTALAGGGAAIVSAIDDKGVDEQRRELHDLLSKSDKTFLVIVDDIDRLDDSEIKEIMRLVKLTENFPHIVYLLAFERKRVEQALQTTYGGSPESGRIYLDKIIQVIHDMPYINESRLSMILAKSIEQATQGQHGLYDQSELDRVYKDIVLPICENVRAVKRYRNAVPAAIDSVGEEINLTDILALEALRVTSYNVFALLPDMLTSIQKGVSAIGDEEKRSTADRARQLVNEVVTAAGSRGDVLQQFLRHIFPMADSIWRHGHNTLGASFYRDWRLSRRVANPEVFRFYLERTLGEGELPVRQVQEFFEALTDGSRMRALLDGLDVLLVGEAMGRLEVYESEFPINGISGAVAALMDQTPRFYLAHPVRRWEDPSLAVRRIVLRLLRRVEPISQRLAIVTAAFDEVESIAGKCLLAELVGYRENSGHKLIRRTDSAALDRRARDAVRSLTPDELAREPNVGELMDWEFYVDQAEGRTWNTEQIRDPAVLIALLRSSRSENVTSDGIHTEHLPVLLWPWLVRMVDESALVSAIEQLPESGALESIDSETREVVDLALRYANGWRPPDPMSGVRVTAVVDSFVADEEADPDGEERERPPKALEQQGDAG